MIADAASHALVVSVEDGFRQGGAGTAVRTALRDNGSDVPVEVMGVPIDYIDHACLDLLANWEKQHELTGGKLYVDWEGLQARFRDRNSRRGPRAVAAA